MSVINEIKVRSNIYEGKGELEFVENEIRFNVLKQSNHVVAGALFGILGRMIAEAMSSGNGKVVTSFTPAEVSGVKFSSDSYNMVYYFYINGNTSPMEITIEKDTYLNRIIKQHFGDKLEEIMAR